MKRDMLEWLTWLEQEWRHKGGDLGKLIKAAREKQGISQEELVDMSRLDISVFDLREMEDGRLPSDVVLNALAPFLGIPASYLIHMAKVIHTNMIINHRHSFLRDVRKRSKPTRDKMSRPETRN